MAIVFPSVARQVLFEDVSRVGQPSYSPPFRPFGLSTSRNSLEAHDSVKGEKPTKVLFIDCGDLKNVLKTVVAQPKNNAMQLQIHINETCGLSLARNILLLSIFERFSVRNDDDIAYLWEVWYNAELTEPSRKRLCGDLEVLLNGKLPKRVNLTQKNLSVLQDIWRKWRSALNVCSLTNPELIKIIQYERTCFIKDSWNKLHPGNTFDAVVTHLIAQLTEVKMFGSSTASKRVIEEEARRYFESGNCSLRNKEEIYSSFNPTLLEPVTLRWRVHFASCPFDSYLSLLTEEISEENQDSDQIIRLCRKALRNLVLAFYQRREAVEFTFHLGDPLHCAITENDFDVIDCGDLSDRVGFINVLAVFGAKLSPEAESILLTDVSTWISTAPSVRKFVEEDLLLGISSSLMPSLYGMRLVFEERAIRPTPLDYDQLIVPLLPLRMKKTLPFENVTLVSSPPMEHYLERLRKACFVDCHRLETPFTFQYVLLGLSRRGADNGWIHKLWSEAAATVGSHLACQTLNTWLERHPLRQFSFSVPFCSFRLAGRANLRLVLQKPNSTEDELLYIDNLQIDFKKNVDDAVDSIQVSFLLPVNELLRMEQENYDAILNDTCTGQPIFNFGLVQNMKQSDFTPLHPLANHPTAVSTYGIYCLEMNDCYVIQISMDEMLKGTTLSFGGVAHKVEKIKPPCISANRLNLIVMGKAKAPVTTEIPITLPYAFDGDSGVVSIPENIAANCQPTAELKFKKVPAVEPWPSDFNSHSKWCIDRLQHWRQEYLDNNNSSDYSGDVHYHIRCQYNSRSVFGPPFPPAELKKPAIDTIRSIIASLFRFVCDRKDDRDVFLTVRFLESTVRSMGEAEKHLPDLFIRVHPPFLISPLGLPFLSMSVFDQPASLKLVGRGKVDGKHVINELKRIYCDEKQERTICLMTNTEEESRLFRSILHANSARIIPSAWQKKHLPDFWMATFLCPLYTDQPAHISDMNTSKKHYKFVDVKLNQGFRPENSELCAKCKKRTQDLKRCARCKKVLYCSVDCQRSDWNSHKSICQT